MDQETMRVAWVVGRLNVGGPAAFILDVASALERRGVRSLIVAGIPGEREGDLTGEARARGLEVVTVPEMGRALAPLRDVVALGRVYAALARFRPHVVQTQTAKAGALGRIAAVVARVPLIVHTFHGHVFDHYFSPSTSRAIAAAERALAAFTDVLASVSTRQAEEIAARLGLPRDRVVTSPIGVDVRRFDGVDRVRGELRRSLGIPESAPLVLALGRVIAIKRLPLLVEALAIMRAAAPSGSPAANARLLVVGDGDRRDALLSWLRARGFDAFVHLALWRRDLTRVFADADVVALASRSEGTPMVILEAMAAGRAVVATRVGGVPEMIDDERTGLLVPPDDLRALAHALQRVCGDAVLRHALGQAAARIARERFDLEGAADRLLALYRTQLSARLPAGLRSERGRRYSHPA